jgi:hypothetical protein
MLPKKPCVLAIFSNFGNPCAKKVIPAKMVAAQIFDDPPVLIYMKEISLQGALTDP